MKKSAAGPSPAASGPRRTWLSRSAGRLAVERADPAYAKRRAADAERRGRKQEDYVEEFRARWPTTSRSTQGMPAGRAPRPGGRRPRHARRQRHGRADAASPSGSAEAAVIAWMRHRTTAYDHTPIPRIKGKRREVRRMLAAQSKRPC